MNEPDGAGIPLLIIRDDDALDSLRQHDTSVVVTLSFCIQLLSCLSLTVHQAHEPSLLDEFRPDSL